MKLIQRLLFIMILLLAVQTSTVFAQVAGVNLAAHGVLAIIGGNREKKQEKIIEKSSTPEKISGANVVVLRVKESDIKSKAKIHIIALQNRLTQYNTQYKNNQPIIVPKNDSDLIAIQDMDENWPTDEYASELRAYKRYAAQQKQQLPAAPRDSLHSTPAGLLKKDTAGVKL
ncbi:hypothetical protein QWZ08_07085 [Ferruginibacter paludis]|uniref:hypothetical protein n=1 Tax=Ferruginibacter paludis TaxID=1310417 RepID=UPI0025B4AD3A|nr:hypothetical protein [Ferruginibacter paludis]MDN3655381.1 hypothetical protein [Ferruginibacter paludis]